MLLPVAEEYLTDHTLPLEEDGLTLSFYIAPEV